MQFVYNFFNLYRLKLILMVYMFINISNTTIICMDKYEVKGVRKLKYQRGEILMRGGHQQEFVQH